jgi:hypothetical protein
LAAVTASDAKLLGVGKGVHPFFISFQVVEPPGGQEVLPLAFGRLDQRLRRRKLFDKGPGGGRGPIVERVQGGGIILVERLDELVDQTVPTRPPPSSVVISWTEKSHFKMQTADPPCGTATSSLIPPYLLTKRKQRKLLSLNQMTTVDRGFVAPWVRQV